MTAKKQSPAQILQPAKRLERRKIKDIQPYHRQDAMFHPLRGDDYERFKADIQKRGLDHPIEITPDNILVDGHQRLRAVTQLGWEEVSVWVRDDLTVEQVEQRHLDANRNRRQLDTLDQVRAAVRTFELKKGCEPGRLSDRQRADLKKTLAEMIDHSERNTQRYLNVVRAPMDVQKAVSDGKLKLVLAANVCRLAKHVQAKIAEEIHAGGNPTEIVNAHLPKPAPKKIDPGKALGKLVAELEVGMTHIAGQEAKVKRTVDELAHEVDVLQRFGEFSRNLLQTLEDAKNKRAKLKEDFAGIADELRQLGKKKKGRR